VPAQDYEVDSLSWRSVFDAMTGVVQHDLRGRGDVLKDKWEMARAAISGCDRRFPNMYSSLDRAVRRYVQHDRRHRAARRLDCRLHRYLSERQSARSRHATSQDEWVERVTRQPTNTSIRSQQLDMATTCPADHVFMPYIGLEDLPDKCNEVGPMALRLCLTSPSHASDRHRRTGRQDMGPQSSRWR